MDATPKPPAEPVIPRNWWTIYPGELYRLGFHMTSVQYSNSRLCELYWLVPGSDPKQYHMVDTRVVAEFDPGLPPSTIHVEMPAPEILPTAGNNPPPPPMGVPQDPSAYADAQRKRANKEAEGG